MLGDLVRGEGRAWDLYHGAELERYLPARFLVHLGNHVLCLLVHLLKLVHVADERDHDLGVRLQALRPEAAWRRAVWHAPACR